MNEVQKMFVGYENSLRQFDSYRYTNTDVETNRSKAPVEKILEPWAINKTDLWKMFGEKLILSRNVEYKRGRDELEEEMHKMLQDQWNFVNTFKTSLADELDLPDAQWHWHDRENTPNENFFYTMSAVLSADNLVDARIPCNISATICGQRMTFAEGQKTMRALGKVCRALGMESEFESFRVAQSMVLNQAKLRGKLCLSIHPLDYATASDNCNGWSSCMSWEEQGCYRLGTVEMMTSPMVICAYLASDSVEMDIGEGKWNSKKWRAWIIVNNDFIVVNRNYPYDNDDLMFAAVEWVKELAEPYYNVKYDEITHDWNQGEHYDICMHYMYNDMTQEHVGCYARIPSWTQSVNVSGPAICMWCGEEIPFDEYDDDGGANTLTCMSCSGAHRCACCNSYVSDDYVFWDSYGNAYCESCYNDKFGMCDCCEESYEYDDLYRLTLPIDHDWAVKWIEKHDPNMYHYVPSELTTFVCKGCIADAGLKLEELTWELDWVPYRAYSRWYPNGCDWEGMLFNPKSVTWEKVATLFNLNEENEFQKAIWEHFQETADLSFWERCKLN